jgi:hypothetical protein
VLSEDAGEEREKSRTGAGGRTGLHSKSNWLLWSVANGGEL